MCSMRIIAGTARNDFRTHSDSLPYTFLKRLGQYPYVVDVGTFVDVYPSGPA
jgi:hypothetical protein